MNNHRTAYLRSSLAENKVKRHPLAARPLPKREGVEKNEGWGRMENGFG
jgi:hypothetical protein